MGQAEQLIAEAAATGSWQDDTTLVRARSAVADTLAGTIAGAVLPQARIVEETVSPRPTS